MKRYTVDVVETVAQSRTYVVEAHSEDEARRKADAGDTLSEWYSRTDRYRRFHEARERERRRRAAKAPCTADPAKRAARAVEKKAKLAKKAKRKQGRR